MTLGKKDNCQDCKKSFNLVKRYKNTNLCEKCFGLGVNVNLGKNTNISSRVNYQIHPKENLYFKFRVFFSLIFYIVLFKLLIAAGPQLVIIKVYAIIIAVYILFRHGLLIGYIKGNAIRLTPKQFPGIYKSAEIQSKKLGLHKIPSIYLMQAGGLLNAFATRFFGRNYVVIYSEILETAYQKGNKAVDFIIGHELGHIKRNHMTKNLLLFPSLFVPFLGAAYSRACEYTCDRIGYVLCREGSKTGMLILAAGKHLHSNVNIDEYIFQSNKETGFWKWFAEVLSSHPNLPKRLAEMKNNARL